ncbi:MAG: hypothetical protein II336_17215 [Loktanella sp.]|nr:hypothetical protein [Loktanella sp.]
MSHSEKDLDRQVTRHRGPIYGITAVLVFVAVLLFWWLGTEAVEAPGPVDDDDGTVQTTPDQGVDVAPIEDAPNAPTETVPETVEPAPIVE